MTMANISEIYILTRNLYKSHPQDDTPGPEVVRSYESRNRAEEDLELLADIATDGTYAVLTVPYIDR